MAFGLKTLARWIDSRKKRHNTDAEIALSKPLSRAEFLRVYESMPDAARASLFTTLSEKQKQKLLSLLAPEVAAHEEDLEPKWQAEDFLPEKDERKVERLRQVSEFAEIKSIFARIEKHAPEQLAEILSSESNSISAMMLLQLEKKYASQVLKALPELMRSEIVRAMATERRIVGEALVAAAKNISARLERSALDDVRRVDGVKHVSEILKLMGVSEANRITREVSSSDARLASKLEENRYQFEDIAELSAKDFRTLFSSIPDEELWARALKAFDQGRRKHMLSKLPLKRSGRIVQRMSEIKTTRLDSIDVARSKILTQAIGLAARHEIRLDLH